MDKDTQKAAERQGRLQALLPEFEKLKTLQEKLDFKTKHSDLFNPLTGGELWYKPGYNPEEFHYEPTESEIKAYKEKFSHQRFSEDTIISILKDKALKKYERENQVGFNFGPDKDNEEEVKFYNTWYYQRQKDHYLDFFIKRFEEKFNVSLTPKKLIEYELQLIDDFEKSADKFFEDIYKSTDYGLHKYQTHQDSYRQLNNGHIINIPQPLKNHFLELEYLRLNTGYYGLNENRIKTEQTAHVEARYFLFKKYLLKRLESNDKPQEFTGGKEGIITINELFKNKFDEVIQIFRKAGYCDENGKVLKKPKIFALFLALLEKKRIIEHITVITTLYEILKQHFSNFGSRQRLNDNLALFREKTNGRSEKLIRNLEKELIKSKILGEE